MKDINELRKIEQGIQTSFIQGGFISDNKYIPELLINDNERGVKVLSTVEQLLKDCDNFSISVAFITDSGVTPLLQILKELEEKGIPGKILTTDYLMFSEPKALRRLAELKNITVRMYQTRNASLGFHTKGYCFQKDGIYQIIIGSSNLTQSALTINQEWNARLVSTKDGKFAKEVNDEFERLWTSPSTQDFAFFINRYETEYNTIKKQQSIAKGQTPISSFVYNLKPNKMQVAFIDNLKKSLQDGNQKGLLISATGTGKTYASAFGVRDALKPNGKVLFIVHRKQILNQAKDTYENVFGKNHSMALLTGEEKNFDEILNAEFVFAMITMISKDDILERFKRDEFSTIVVDEVHHAAAKSYIKVMDYFKPNYWLGMTATPDRTDGGNIFEMFDHNIIYEIRLQQALENDLLCPFHYFGIKDIAFRPDENADELIKRAERNDFSVFNRLTSDERVDYVIKQAKYYGYSGNRVKGLIFCSSVKEAIKLSESFNQKGLRTIALSGDDNNEDREDAIERLTSDERSDYLDYILTVNIFNEGVDIPEINQVIMLRPTESAIVFIQQLGRGLRKRRDKEFVVILDFIGNYSNNFLIPIALSGDRTYNKDNMRKYLMEGSSVIPGCSTIHFDEISKQQIFAAIDKATTPLAFLKEKYNVLKNRLGRMPTMVEFYKYGEVDPILFVEYKGESYYRFMRKYDKKCTLPEFSSRDEATLDFISTEIANGKRPHELFMLRSLLKTGKIDYLQLEQILKKYNIIFRIEDYNSAVRVLSKRFLNTQSGKLKYKDVSIVEESNLNKMGLEIRATSFLINVLYQQTQKNVELKKALEDIVEYGILRFEEAYSDIDESNMVLYQKYSRKDVCRILNWERDDSSTMYGYQIKYSTCPIFVTYDKKDDISETTKYNDKFIDSQYFSWMTRSRKTINSAETQKIINYEKDNLRLYLFIKKSDDEGADFYYLGPVYPKNYRQTTISDKNGKMIPIMNFELQLKHAVRNDVYEYLTQ